MLNCWAPTRHYVLWRGWKAQGPIRVQPATLIRHCHYRIYSQSATTTLAKSGPFDQMQVVSQPGVFAAQSDSRQTVQWDKRRSFHSRVENDQASHTQNGDVSLCSSRCNTSSLSSVWDAPHSHDGTIGRRKVPYLIVEGLVAVNAMDTRAVLGLNSAAVLSTLSRWNHSL